ncbi:amino acid adenylation domain-containing protein [Dictyobacter arantiisoli]|nr:non-ribosomal peptide synthetase [Dictyobacter arantiisoli]
MSETLVESFRLSPQQRHLCVLPQPGEFFPYHTYVATLLQGPLDLSRLSDALKQLVERYEILRTYFPRQAGFALPAQVINSEILLPLEVYDFSSLSAIEQEARLLNMREAAQKRPFPLAEEPCWRVTVIRCAAERHWVWWDLATLHADTQTCHLLLQELSQCYSESERDEEEPLQYADLAEWLYDVLQAGEESAGEAYWRTSTKALKTIVPLPSERKRAADPGAAFIPQTLTLALPEEMQAQLHNLARRLAVSESSLLLTCWGTVLARLTEQSELLIGTGYDGRKYQEVSKAIGLFAKVLPLCYPFKENARYYEAARQVEETMQKGDKWQEYFGWQNVDVLPDGEEPFCAFGFRYETIPDLWHAGGLTWKVEEQKMDEDCFKVNLVCQQGPDHLHVCLRYDQSIFLPQDMQRLLQQWWHVCEQVITNPDVTLAALELLTEEERHLITSVWNATATNHTLEPALHQLFEEQARRYPQAPALQSGALRLSYEQLDQQANQLAHLLRTNGMQPGNQVVLCLPRDHWAIISMLAVLKAGGIYVPLEMEVPSSRLQAQFNQLSPVLVLTNRELRNRLPDLTVPVLAVETLAQSLSEQPATAPERGEGNTQELAAIMFTSGSTGAPKGVLVRQQSVSNYTRTLCTLLEVQAGWHFATVSSLATDLGNTAIFCGLASGGCVHILPYELVTDAAALSAYAQKHPLDVLKIVPSHLQTLLSSEAEAILPRARLVLGGERLSWSLVEQIQQLRPDCRIFNHYGPTEATVGALVYPLGQAGQLQLPQERQSGVPIGRPIDNVQVYLLDEHLHLVPVGVTGEIFIGGEGISQGYLAAPDLTAERFVPDAWSPTGSGRLYRTGDRARYGRDGVVEFIGREDTQVKLRGYRIELGEIEEQLRRVEAVKDAIVQLRKEEAGEGYLVGYIVPREQPGPTQEQVREALREQLPEHLVPGRVLQLESIPRMANGKVDWRRLPAPQAEEQEETRSARQMQSPVEEVMQGVWQKVLNRKPIGRMENFFRLGGHSLLGTRVTARLRTIFGMDVPITWLFESPTIAQLSRQISEKLRQGQGVEMPPIVPQVRSQALPLSFAQQRLWFLDQLEPGRAVYNIPRAVRLRGPLNRIALAQALQGVIQRHENLRTTFPVHEGQPIQQISPEPLTQMIVLDLSKLDQQEREREAHRLAQQEAEFPFDLAHGPLLHCWLLLLKQEEQVLLLNLHHIVSDGWSSGILVRELSILYSAFPRSDISLLPRLPIQYADYALWQRSWLQGEVLERQINYWKGQLAGLTPLELPTDHPRPAIQTFQGGLQRLLLPSQLSQQLQELSQREGATLFMTLLASFQILLSRYSGQGDIAVGTPIANRTSEEIESLIGFFINTLVLRTDLSDNPSFVDVLTQVRTIALDAYTHQDVPFEQVVDAVQPQRDLSRSPLFQVLFELRNMPESEESTALTSVQAGQFIIEQHTTKFDLSMVITAGEQGLYTDLEYNTDLFEPETIQRMFSHWQALLEGIVANPDARIAALPLLTEHERELLLNEWNATNQKQGEGACIHLLFEEQVQRTPDAVALVFEEEQLTYAAVNQLANRLAYALQERGVGPETLVGLFLERSPEQIIGLLGVLKAGGTYIPLDPGYPRERLAFLLTDAQPTILLIQSHLKEACPPCEALILSLDIGGELFASQPSENLNQTTTGENLAYVIYTSGSTGQPKGVQVRHEAVVNLLVAVRSQLGRSKPAVIPALTTLAFDIAALEILLPLLQGDRCVLVPRTVAVDGRSLAQLLEEMAATTIQATPTTWQMLLTANWQAAPHLQLLCGGEALPRSLADRLIAQGASLWNLYGPTETTIWSAIGQVKQGDEAVSIGRPINNTQLYVLDKHLQPVPIGVAGELYIGGIGVARGYLQRAEQTAERFVPHPFSAQKGARIYRTGDLVRYHADGTLQYLERLDQQVKLRGYRIEFGEIEHTLLEHPAVQECVVMVREDVVEGGYLVAYVVGEAEQELPAEQQLRRYVQEKLPVYMVPASIVALEHIPLTPNGKINRRDLPAPHWNVAEEQEQGGGTKLLEPLEELVLQTWQQVLQRDQIGLQENFFEIGGHSLLATQVIARLRQLIKIELPLRALFEAPTISSLATRLQQLLLLDQGLATPPLIPVSRNQPLPLSFAQQRLWFLHQLAPQSAAYTIPVAARLQGALDIPAFQSSLAALIQRHESLRTTFEEHEGLLQQHIMPASFISFPLIDFSASDEYQRDQEIQRLVRQEAEQPFDLKQGPLLRCWLLRLAQQEHILLLTMHHIVSDGWSMGVLVREITELYHAFRAGKPSPLPPLPIQYADYASWQRSWLQGDALEAQLRYWTHQLNDAHALQLSTDFSRSSTLSYRGARYGLPVNTELAQQLRQLSQQEGVTLFMTLLAAFQILLYRLSGDEDIVVGTDTANRSHLETEGIIGFFINLLALRTNLQDHPSFIHLLQRVREMVLGAYAHQELPFETIVEHLRLPRTGNHTPLVNVLFVLQNVPHSESELADIVVRPVEQEAVHSKFDLALFVTEDSQGLYCTANYSTDLFKRETIEMIMQRYHTLLHSIVNQPHAKIASLEIATENEKAQKARQQTTLRQNLKLSRGARMRLTEENGEHLPDKAE